MHAPVLVAEVISHLVPARGGLFVDCTLGAGGHTRALLDAGATRVLGFDRDRTALALAAETLQDRLDRVEMVHADYRSLGTALDSRGIASVDGGILADLGVSSMQLDDAERGFSFRADAPLDMRMDRDSGQSAAALLQTVDEVALANIIYEFGEERFSRRIARGIVRAREVRSDRDDQPTGCHRSSRRSHARLATHRSRDANVPGPAYLGQSGTRGPRRLHPAGRRSAGRRGTARDHRVPLARRPHRQAHIPGPGAGARSAGRADHAAAHRGLRGRDRAQSPCT